MAQYFNEHRLFLGVDTEVLCWCAYQFGDWGLSKFRYGEKVESERTLLSCSALTESPKGGDTYVTEWTP